MPAMGKRGAHIVLRFIVKRILQLIPILLAVSVLIFLMVRITPTDPIASMTKGRKISQETRTALEQQYYLDRSLLEQYVIWITNAVRGDFGDSLQHRQPVANLVAERLPTTLQLVFMSAVFAVVLAIPIGIISAVKMNTAADRILSGVSLLFVSSPAFLTAIVLILIFSLRLGWFPSFGTGGSFGENFYYLALPAIALSLNMVALIARITRSNMIEQLQSNYTVTAISKGTPYWKVVLRHCLKNTIIPVITVASIQIGSMIVGAVLVENVFALGGLGALLIDGIKASDYPVVQSITLMLVTMFLLINLFVDVIYALIDPRIRVE